MEYDLDNAAFHSQDAFMQASYFNFGPKLRIIMEFTESDTSFSNSDAEEPSVLTVTLDYPLSDKRLILNTHKKTFRS